MAVYQAHESAIIDNGCSIGEGTRIWHFSHIMEHCVIGKNCTIGQNVVISPDVVLGNHELQRVERVWKVRPQKVRDLYTKRR